ncbi:ATP-binding protein [Shimazuella sp. AN120528]|uniref:HAMP domain-containing sensor histidine kinase n=1 Tax=Shimazuella soli TaxID=1892854 RepID=UPI001F0D6900|nr:ATP-binding protein [Shimazuella soli]MCH5586738.1 ATP-binding protein [Shimazuella soli]
MKFRNKLIISLIILIVFLGSTYYAITYLYTQQMIQSYAQNIRQVSAEQWSNQLSYFYQENDSSWFGVDEFVHFLADQSKDGDRIDNLTLLDSNGNVLSQIGSGMNNTETISVDISVADKKVGELELSSSIPNRLDIIEQTVFHSMTMGTFVGIIITSLVALLVGVWLSRLITSPLQSMIRSMEKIKDGDLQAKLHINTEDEFGKVGETFNLMADRLYRTEQARSHLVADVAHELRTPLTIIQGQMELIQQGIKKAEPAALLPIQDEVSRLIHLVQDLHQLSLAEVGQLPLKRTETDLARLLKNIVNMYELEAIERKIELKYEQENIEQIPLLLVDPNRITQVFVNLITNALSHTAPQGKVFVILEPLEQEVQIHVKDSGHGIAEEHIPYVFDRFYRADKDRSREHGGMGLGLAIAKEYVEAHQGYVTVKSKLGEGTTFTVHLKYS